MKKRILALLMAATLTLGMSMTAFAADDTTATNYLLVKEATDGASKVADTTHDLTINNAEGHTLTAYQIFSMTVYNNADVTVDGWGSGLTTDAQAALASVVGVSDSDAYSVAVAFKVTETQTAADIDNFINTASKYLGTGTTEFSNLETGYYLVADTVDGKTAYSLQLVLEDGMTVEAKVGTVTVEKKVDDVNDSSADGDALEELVDSADYDVNDEVPYTLTGTVSDAFNSKNSKGEYYAYPYAFLDKIANEEALVLNADTIKVYVGETDVTSYFSIDTNSTEEYTFKVYTEDLHNVPGVTTSSKITVKFTATLTEKAVVGAEGNDNEAKIEYGNGSSTEWDTVRVFTYALKFTKKDEYNNNLTGAGFQLYKYEASETEGTLLSEDDFNALVNARTENNYYLVDEIAASDDNSVFEFSGLDAGDYVLVESEVPTGYNRMTPVAFTISATHEQSGDADQLVLDTLTSTLSSFTVETTENGAFTGYIVGEIENRQGTILPSTGGMGTTLFYLVGGVLVIGAGVILFVRKKMANEQ